MGKQTFIYIFFIAILPKHEKSLCARIEQRKNPNFPLTNIYVHSDCSSRSFYYSNKSFVPLSLSCWNGKKIFSFIGAAASIIILITNTSPSCCLLLWLFFICRLESYINRKIIKPFSNQNAKTIYSMFRSFLFVHVCMSKCNKKNSRKWKKIMYIKLLYE